MPKGIRRARTRVAVSRSQIQSPDSEGWQQAAQRPFGCMAMMREHSVSHPRTAGTGRIRDPALSGARKQAYCARLLRQVAEVYDIHVEALEVAADHDHVCVAILRQGCRRLS